MSSTIVETFRRCKCCGQPLASLKDTVTSTITDDPTIPAGEDCQTCEVCGSPWGTLHERTPFGAARPHWVCCHSPYANHPHGPPCCEYLGSALDEFPDREVAIRVARERRECVVQAWKEGKS
jgi:hypothetical protein